MSSPPDARRVLPSVDALLAEPDIRDLRMAYSSVAVTRLVRQILADERLRLTERPASTPLSPTDLTQRVILTARSRWESSLGRVYNATGVIIHTNLGRAPLSTAAIQAIASIAGGYCVLEYDEATGQRGSRHRHLEALLADLTTAEAGLVVNNNAAALVVILAALARGKEVILSRGQSVEIGGGFRIPDIMRQSGVRLVEVGTTNRTRIADYASALGPKTAALLRVHPSNFVQQGFVEETPLDQLVELAHRHNIPVIDDVGSGCLLDLSQFGLAAEPRVQESVATGADIVCFSGDKLLGGPQAGVIVGRQAAVERIKRHSLVRALRVDKVTIAVLHATLLHYLRDEAIQHIPIWRMIAAPREEIAERAARWQQRLHLSLNTLEDRTENDSASETRSHGLRMGLRNGLSTIGGGSLPGQTLPTTLVSIQRQGREASGWAARLAGALRQQNPAIIARVEDGAVVCDPRTILPEEDHAVLTGLEQCLATMLQEKKSEDTPTARTTSRKNMSSPFVPPNVI